MVSCNAVPYAVDVWNLWPKAGTLRVLESRPLDWYQNGAGVETEHHPLHCILDLSEEEHPANPHLAAELTATYPEVWDKAHGRKIISNYPNQGACRMTWRVACIVQAAWRLRFCISAHSDAMIITLTRALCRRVLHQGVQPRDVRRNI